MRSLQGGAFEAVGGDGIADVLDGEIGGREGVAVRVDEARIGGLGVGDVDGGEGGERRGRGRVTRGVGGRDGGRRLGVGGSGRGDGPAEDGIPGNGGGSHGEAGGLAMSCVVLYETRRVVMVLDGVANGRCLCSLEPVRLLPGDSGKLLNRRENKKRRRVQCRRVRGGEEEESRGRTIGRTR